MKNILFALSLTILFACSEKNPLTQAVEDLPDDATFTYLPTDLNRMDEFVAIGQIYDLPKAPSAWAWAWRGTSGSGRPSGAV